MLLAQLGLEMTDDPFDVGGAQIVSELHTHVGDHLVRAELARQDSADAEHSRLAVPQVNQLGRAKASLIRDDPREQFRTGAAMFGGFIATALVLGWLMYPFPL